jgi:DNA-binding MarR family transcriptional regulator
MAKTKSETLNSLGREVSDVTVLMHEAIARNVGLSGLDHKYLSIILRQGSLTAGELSVLTGLTTGAVTGVIDRLEKKKLVKRVFNESDRRKILIVPNVEKATKLFENAHLDLRNQIESLISTFSEKEIKIIERYLSSSIKIMKNVTDRLNKK